jgi:hypothetical protein
MRCVHRAIRLSALAGLLALLSAAGAAAAPARILFDSDIGPDCDDAGTMAVLHALADAGEAVVLGMACCTGSEWGAPCLDAINTWYGRPDVPVGTIKTKPGFLCGGGDHKYNERVAKDFPNRLKSGTNAPDAVALYRKVLAAQPDGSVTMVAVGPLPNVAALLDSKADAASPLDGVALVKRKARLLVVMGGRHPSGKEWNFEQDGPAAKRVCEAWPTSAVFSGGEVGEPVQTGARLGKETPPENPVRKAYELYNGPGKNRSSWDQTAMLYAIRGEAGLFRLSPEGTIAVAANGKNDWTAAAGGLHRYLIKAVPDAEIAKAIDELMVRPPKKR